MVLLHAVSIVGGSRNVQCKKSRFQKVVGVRWIEFNFELTSSTHWSDCALGLGPTQHGRLEEVRAPNVFDLQKPVELRRGRRLLETTIQEQYSSSVASLGAGLSLCPSNRRRE